MSFYRYYYETYIGSASADHHRSLIPLSRNDITATNPFTYRWYTSEAENTDSKTCYVVSIGYERRPHKDSGHYNRSYNRYCFHYFVGGRGWYNGEPILAGQMLIVPPCEELFFESDSENPLEFYYITVSGKGSEALFSSAGFELSTYLCECPFISQIPDLFFSPLFENHSDTDPSFYLMSFFLQLMGYHKKYNYTESSSYKGASFYYYSQAIFYIESYLLSDITPTDIADFLNISYSYLRKIFSQYCECSVRDYILKQRFKYAADKMVLTQCSVKEAAELIGYSDYVHFSKMFKKIIGTSPSLYRDSHKST